jgi:FlaA1/EpsC-like NDP-sugar epimerase
VTRRRKVAVSLIGLSSAWKAALTMAADAVVLVFASVVAVALTNPSLEVLTSPLIALITVGPAITIPMLFAFGGYSAVVRFIGPDFAKRMALTMLVTLAALEGFYAAMGHLAQAWNVSLLYALIGFCSVTLLRLTVRHLLLADQPSSRKRVLIYGAGEAGRQLAAALMHGGVFRPVGFVDDQTGLRGRTLLGLKIYSPGSLDALREKVTFDSVLLALPSISQKRRREILEALAQLSVKVFTMPRMDDLASGRKQIDDLREIQIEDLLGRTPVTPNEALLDAPIRDRVVMITGAGGSIGSELSRITLQRGAKRIVLFENSEYALYTIHAELSAAAAKSNCEIVPVLGSVTDAHVFGNVLKQHAVETLYHAAAYKHVPLVEHNIAVAIQNNVMGTWVAAETAMSAGVQNFVLVSTDKAVRPTSIMGASKRICELIVQAMADRYSNTRVAIVRFGNVLGSSGSVVPLFMKQIRDGGPVTVTHPDVTRYFMTISEAAQLVVQAGSMGRHGEVFVLDMGEPVLIRDLAARMIQLAGFQVRSDKNPNGDIEIAYTGLRPGEKLYEELLIGDAPEGTTHPRIYHARDPFIQLPQLKASLDVMTQAIKRDELPRLVTEIRNLVAGFGPAQHAAPQNQAPMKLRVVPRSVEMDSGNAILAPGLQ